MDTDGQMEFLGSCRAGRTGVAVSEGAFSAGPALWVGRREIAHFDDERTLDVRLTKAVIRSRRDKFTGDDRVALRRNSSDWVEILIESEGDLDWARRLVRDAVAANEQTAPPGVPPTGAELERRRRFH